MADIQSATAEISRGKEEEEEEEEEETTRHNYNVRICYTQGGVNSIIEIFYTLLFDYSAVTCDKLFFVT